MSPAAPLRGAQHRQSAGAVRDWGAAATAADCKQLLPWKRQQSLQPAAVQDRPRCQHQCLDSDWLDTPLACLLKTLCLTLASALRPTPQTLTLYCNTLCASLLL